MGRLQGMVLVVLVWLLCGGAAGARTYEPTAASLAGHQVAGWWTDAKFGIFIHWGVYAVPAYAPKQLPVLGYAEQYWRWQQIPGSLTWQHHLLKYGPEFLYDDFIPQFRAERYDPDAWIKLFADAGAKYFVLTSKHLDGFRLWPSPVSDRNSVRMGPRRDLVGDLFAAAHRAKDRVRPGLYYQVPEQFNPAPRPATAFMGAGTFTIGPVINAQIPPKNAYTGQLVPYTGYKPVSDYATGSLLPDVHDLVTRYHPEVLWCDWGGDGEYLQSNRLISDYYNATERSNPDGVVVDDRCGNASTHRDFRTVEYDNNFTGNAESGPTEETRGMGNSFGYNAEETDADLATSDELIDGLVRAVSAGSNYLLDIGPKADGTIPVEMSRRLLDIGAWLKVNGTAIYGSRAWTTQTDPGDDAVHYTRGADGAVYAIRHGWPGATLTLAAPVPTPAGTVVTLLGDDRPLPYRAEGGRLVITMPAQQVGEHSFSVRIGPPAAVARQRPRLALTLRRAGSRTRVRGTLKLPAGVARSACAGSVTLRPGGRRATVGRGCTFMATLRRTRTVTARFNGTRALLPARVTGRSR